jgi:hypothetical protein
VDESPSFHGGSPETYQGSLPRPNATVMSVPVSQGHAIFHHQDIWHGSGPNRSTTQHRRALVGHYLRGGVHFKQDSTGEMKASESLYQTYCVVYSINLFTYTISLSYKGTPPKTPWGQVSYIYGRYRRYQSVEVDESFFPIVYASPGQGQQRTVWLDEYIQS